MTAYVAVLSAKCRVLLQYRTAAAAGIFTQVFWGFIRVMIFEAFYRSTDAPQPMQIAEVITYVWLGQTLFRLLPWDVEPEVRDMIRFGNVAYELLRPVDVYWLWYSRSVAGRVAPTVLRAVPMAALAIPFFGMGLPASVGSFGAWAVATAGAVILGSAITTFATITLLWTISGLGINRLLPAVVFAMSGMLVPLALLPDWLRPVFEFLPFAGLVDTPFRLYMGHLPPAAVVGVVARQLAWAGGTVLFGRWLLARGVRRLVVQGG
jgi:ABC-2 type transport system permease protein